MVLFRSILIIMLASTATVAFADKDWSNQWCHELSTELQSVHFESCKARPWQLEAMAKSGHPIPSVRWGDGSGKRILVIGAIHGNEISAVSIVFRWLDFLDQSKSDSELRKNQYLLFPLLNPDGFYANPRTRTNSSGVDLNRNFETKLWSSVAPAHWKKIAHQEARLFPGKEPASEVETKLIQKRIDEFKPELIISVHAPYGLVDHDGPIEMLKTKWPLPVKTVGAFPGSLGTYAGVERHIPVVTIELGAAKSLPDLKVVRDLFLFVMGSRY